MASIRLHPKYGVNPSIPVCFWCGEDKNEVAMLGAAYKGQAPMRMLMDYTPCAACQAQMDTGITLIELVPSNTVEQPPIAKEGALSHVSPSGRYIVVKDHVISDIFDEAKAADVIRARKAFVDSEVFCMLTGLPK